jgi:hypothetical protein
VCRQNEGSFGFAKRWLLCRAKPNVPECAVGFLFLVFMQQKFLCYSVVGFCLFTMNGNILAFYSLFYHKNSNKRNKYKGFSEKLFNGRAK